MEQLIDFHAPEVQAVLDTLLKDKSTGKNIIWATDPPEELQTVIYRIAISYILGFAKGHGITAHHIRQADTLEFAKASTMERELDKIFRD